MGLSVLFSQIAFCLLPLDWQNLGVKKPTDELSLIHTSLGSLLLKPMLQDPLLPGSRLRMTPERGERSALSLGRSWGCTEGTSKCSVKAAAGIIREARMSAPAHPGHSACPGLKPGCSGNSACLNFLLFFFFFFPP